jgi:hypothetical protein
MFRNAKRNPGGCHGRKSRRGDACQPHLQITHRQIPHSQVQLLHLAPGKAPRAGIASGFETGRFAYGPWHAHDFLMIHQCFTSYYLCSFQM